MCTTDTSTRHTSRITRLAGVAVAGIVVGVGSALVVDAAADRSAADACPPSMTDYRHAAEEARRLELMDPGAFDTSPRPSDHDDLRLAAEWARRLAILAPHTIPESCAR